MFRLLGVGHTPETFSECFTLVPEDFFQRTPENLWPYYNEDKRLVLPGDNYTGCSVILEKPTNSCWMSFKFEVRQEFTKGYTLPPGTLSPFSVLEIWDANGQKVFWIEVKIRQNPNDLHASPLIDYIRFCAPNHCEDLPLNPNTTYTLDFFFEHRNVALYINDTYYQLQYSNDYNVVTPLRKFQLGDRGRFMEAPCLVDWIVVALDSTRGIEVETQYPEFYHEDVSDWVIGENSIPLLQDTREYKKVIPEVPYIGTENESAQAFVFGSAKKPVAGAQLNTMVAHVTHPTDLYFIKAGRDTVIDLSKGHTIYPGQRDVCLQQPLDEEFNYWNKNVGYGLLMEVE